MESAASLLANTASQSLRFQNSSSQRHLRITFKHLLSYFAYLAKIYHSKILSCIIDDGQFQIRSFLRVFPFILTFQNFTYKFDSFVKRISKVFRFLLFVIYNYVHTYLLQLCTYILINPVALECPRNSDSLKKNRVQWFPFRIIEYNIPADCRAYVVLREKRSSHIFKGRCLKIVFISNLSDHYSDECGFDCS